MSALSISVGKKIKELREGHGLSQRQLAEAAKTSHVTISRIEFGRTATTIDILDRIAHQLDTTPAALLGGESTQPSSALNPKLARLFSDLDESQVTELIPMIQALLRGFQPREQEQTVKPRKKS